MQPEEVKYAGFWVRFCAMVVDGILITIINMGILFLIYGGSFWENEDFINSASMSYFWDIISWIIVFIITVLFWIKKQATPGKMIFSAKIVDAKTGNPASIGRLIVRYLAYYVSIIPLFLGFIWIIFDKRKQGWHDKLAGTVVIRK